jgi:hypothetical protein
VTDAYFESTDVMTGDKIVLEVGYRSARAVQNPLFYEDLSLVHWAARANRHLISGT